MKILEFLKIKVKTLGFWLITFVTLLLTSGIIYRVSDYQADWAYNGVLIFGGVLALFAVVAVIFAFIINPIRDLLRKIKERKG